MKLCTCSPTSRQKHSHAAAELMAAVRQRPGVTCGSNRVHAGRPPVTQSCKRAQLMQCLTHNIRHNQTNAKIITEPNNLNAVNL